MDLIVATSNTSVMCINNTFRSIITIKREKASESCEGFIYYKPSNIYGVCYPE